jgi:hypothetical protein
MGFLGFGFSHIDVSLCLFFFSLCPAKKEANWKKIFNEFLPEMGATIDICIFHSALPPAPIFHPPSSDIHSRPHSSSVPRMKNVPIAFRIKPLEH